MKATSLYSVALVAALASTAQASDKDLHPTFPIAGGKATLQMDFTNAPDLVTWGTEDVAPVVAAWYPKIAAMLPSPGFHPSDVIILQFKTGMKAPAYTMGHTITASTEYFTAHPKDVNALVHEATHIVQAYGASGSGYGHNPVWLVEGLDDYIRFYVVEPETHAALIGPKRAPAVHFNDSYRTTANFLNWVVGKYGADVIVKLNAAMREHTYSPDTWVKLTGTHVEELGDAWKQTLPDAPPVK